MNKLIVKCKNVSIHAITLNPQLRRLDTLLSSSASISAFRTSRVIRNSIAVVMFIATFVPSELPSL
jgi:hypothetical protein